VLKGGGRWFHAIFALNHVKITRVKGKLHVKSKPVEFRNLDLTLRGKTVLKVRRMDDFGYL
jgi:hypothetical protein